MKNNKSAAKLRRKRRVRGKIYGTAQRPRLSVYKSNLHIYAQLIDDDAGMTLVSASSNDKDLRDKIAANEEAKTKSAIAEIVGQELAKKAIAKEISEVVFDRNGNLYHGRVKSIAEGARKAGLKF